MTTNNKEVEEMANRPEWENLKRHLAENYVEKGWTAVTDEVMKDLIASRDTYLKERVRKQVEGMKITSMVGILLDEDEKSWNNALDTLLDNLK